MLMDGMLRTCICCHDLQYIVNGSSNIISGGSDSSIYNAPLQSLFVLYIFCTGSYKVFYTTHIPCSELKGKVRVKGKRPESFSFWYISRGCSSSLVTLYLSNLVISDASKQLMYIYIVFSVFPFLAVQDSSVGDLVTD